MIIHGLEISPSLRHKMNPTLSPLCLKCEIVVGEYVHCIWPCPEIEGYWFGIVQQLRVIFDVDFVMDPICLILDLPNKKLINKFLKWLFNLLTYATRKNILFSWINDKPPTKKSWQKIIMQCMPMEFPTCMLHSTTDVFYNIWDPYLRYIGPNLANTLTLGFLKKSDSSNLDT